MNTPKTTFAPTTTRADSPHARGVLIDKWGRHISYLRLSVTDRCDFRCRYCMPMRVQFLPKSQILSLEESLRVARVFTEMGVRKIRITGGEPLVRPNVTWLCQQIAALPTHPEVALTTNGSQLPKLAKPLQQAGVRRLNISLDTLDARRFADLTRTGKLSTVLAGIDAALAADFIGGIKLNTVMIRGKNDDELAALAQFAFCRGMDISFIEEMPLGDAGYSRADSYFSSDDALTQLRQVFDLHKTDFNSGGPAVYYAVNGGNRKIGFISPHSHNFCTTCNRVRVDAAGKLFPCLGQNEFVDLLDAARQQTDHTLRQKIMQTMDIKPKGHDFDFAETKVMRFMSATGG